MERLTDRDKEIPLPNPDNAQFWARVHEKLALYEDAEENGLLVRFPCKVGDTVYAIVKSKVLAVYVVSIVRREWQPCWTVNLLFDSKKTNGVYAYSIDRFGRDVFLTPEEAEAALKGEYK